MARIQAKQEWEAVKVDPVELACKPIKCPGCIPFDPFEAQQQILRGGRCLLLAHRALLPTARHAHHYLRRTISGTRGHISS